MPAQVPMDPVHEDFYAEYNCPSCKNNWILRTYYNDILKKCPRPNCLVESRPSSSTSYHGSSKVFGQFRCPKCGRSWASNNSWANTPLDCLGCKNSVYPYRQSPLEYVPRGSRNPCNPGIHHQIDLCPKCRQQGYDCSRELPVIVLQGKAILDRPMQMQDQRDPYHRSKYDCCVFI